MVQILIIDDNAVSRVLLAKALQKQGYQVTLANDGEEGLALAKQIHPALIICDWMMPKLDGLEVCRQVKADPQLSTTFFILLTSRVGVDDRVRGLDNGADDFLPKPIELTELKARVRAGLRLHQLTQDLQAKNHRLAQLSEHLKSQQKMMEEELAEAAAYVQSLFPAPMKGSVTINSRFIPSRHLGGDCFDYFWLDPDFLVMYLLDVSGHGLGAALPSVAVLNMLRSQSLESVNFYQPNQVLDALNESFQMDAQNDKYFTIWYGVYDRVNKRLIYSNAGHPPAVLISTNSEQKLEIKQLRESDLPIGMLPETRYKNHICKIEPASTLYIFSDGVYEVQKNEETILGFPAFLNLLLDCHQKFEEDADSTLETLVHKIRQISPSKAFEDDFSILQLVFR